MRQDQDWDHCIPVVPRDSTGAPGASWAGWVRAQGAEGALLDPSIVRAAIEEAEASGRCSAAIEEWRRTFPPPANLGAVPGPVPPDPLVDPPSGPVPVGWADAAGDFRERGPMLFGRAAKVSPYLNPNPTNALGVLLYDVDHPEPALAALRAGSVPRPTWIVRDRESGRFHCAYVLAAPVHRNRASSLAAQEFAADVDRALTGALHADLAFGKRLTRNPWRRFLFAETEWGELAGRKLAQLVPACGIVRPAGEPIIGEGRNVRVFRECLLAAERANWLRLNGRLSWDEVCDHVRTFANSINLAFPVPLVATEEAGIVRSVLRYAKTWRHGKRLTGRERGLASGRARRDRNADRDAAIRALRAEGWTQQAVADRLGIHQGTVSRVLRSAVHMRD